MYDVLKIIYMIVVKRFHFICFFMIVFFLCIFKIPKFVLYNDTFEYYGGIFLMFPLMFIAYYVFFNVKGYLLNKSGLAFLFLAFLAVLLLFFVIDESLVINAFSIKNKLGMILGRIEWLFSLVLLVMVFPIHFLISKELRWNDDGGDIIGFILFKVIFISVPYVISGVFFSGIYSYLFSAGIDDFGGGIDNIVDILYFSFSTITTLGYGDISPESNVGRIVCIIEAVFGVIYTAVIVGVSIGYYLSRNKVREEA